MVQGPENERLSLDSGVCVLQYPDTQHCKFSLSIARLPQSLRIDGSGDRFALGENGRPG